MPHTRSVPLPKGCVYTAQATRRFRSVQAFQQNRNPNPEPNPTATLD